MALSFERTQKHIDFIAKWKPYNAEHYYGVDYADEVPEAWLDDIDSILEECKKETPDFKIFQLKIKFGGLRLYLQDVSEDMRTKVSKLEQKLYDKNLIY